MSLLFILSKTFFGKRGRILQDVLRKLVASDLNITISNIKIHDNSSLHNDIFIQNLKYCLSYLKPKPSSNLTFQQDQ